jgi:hypothetical protein
MKIHIPSPLPDHPRNIMRRLSYGEIPGFQGQISYARRIQGTPFPRFHAYFTVTDQGMDINLHLDQKKATYEKSHAHSGEYSGDAVASEMKRIAEGIEKMRKSAEVDQHGDLKASGIDPDQDKEKGGFWSRLFGT